MWAIRWQLASTSGRIAIRSSKTRSATFGAISVGEVAECLLPACPLSTVGEGRVVGSKRARDRMEIRLETTCTSIARGHDEGKGATGRGDSNRDRNENHESSSTHGRTFLRVGFPGAPNHERKRFRTRSANLHAKASLRKHARGAYVHRPEERSASGPARHAPPASRAASHDLPVGNAQQPALDRSPTADRPRHDPPVTDARRTDDGPDCNVELQAGTRRAR